ncbi:Elongator complex protein 4 [Zopfochytrium polystomum]|nr:Elongator complex protein 4 [Zopfochytrium polystomum]
MITSTGIPTLDDVFGGGLPAGSLALVHEDTPASGFARLILRYFVAQGFAAGHSVCVASAADVEHPLDVMRSLMVPVGTEEDDDGADGEEVDVGGKEGLARQLGSLRAERELKIAWRYQNQGRFGEILGKPNASRGSGTYCFKFDITKAVSQSTLESAAGRVALIDVNEWVESGMAASTVYDKLLATLKEICASGRFSPGTPNMLRVAIQSIASPLWGDSSDQIAMWQALVRFLVGLRAALKGIQAVCMMTIPAVLYDDSHGLSSSPYVRRLHHVVDGVLEVESFEMSRRYFGDAYTSEYHGLLHVHRLPVLSSLTSASRVANTDLHSLAFQVRRKRFKIEAFRLPPDEGDRESESPKSSAALSSRKKSAAGGAADRDRGGGAASGIDF